MSPVSGEEVLWDLKKTFSTAIPTGSEIAARAIARAIAGHESDTAWIKGSFSELVEEQTDSSGPGDETLAGVIGGQ